MSRNPDWSVNETILALWLYNELPPAKQDARTPEVRELTGLLGRTPGSVALKLANLKAQDSSVPGKGMNHASRLDRDLFPLYVNNPEKLFEKRQKILEAVDCCEKDSLAIMKFRKKQYVFRRALLTGYQQRCCLSGIGTPDLLIASHIKPWCVDQEHRTDPRNGLLLNALLDKAFDKGYFTVLPDSYTVCVARNIKDEKTKVFLKQYDKSKIMLPENEVRWPKKEFLEYHNDEIFEKSKSLQLVLPHLSIYKIQS
ncbi:MAG: HNH endonuclease [Sphaerochaetaceae bacterium]